MSKLLMQLAFLATISSACVSQKQYAALQAENERLQTAGPVKAAMSSEEAAIVEEMKAALRLKEQEILEVQRTMEKHKMLEEAASLPQPTPEQMEMYRIQNEKAILESESALVSKAYENDFRQAFMSKEMEYRILHSGLKKALEEYPNNQVNIIKTPGQLLISIAPEALFDENKSSLSGNGTSILNKVIATLKGEQVEDYEVIAVMLDQKENPKAKSLERGQEVYAYLKANSNEKSAPKGMLLSVCELVNEGASKDCDHIFLRIRQDYEELVKDINKSMFQ